MVFADSTVPNVTFSGIIIAAVEQRQEPLPDITLHIIILIKAPTLYLCCAVTCYPSKIEGVARSDGGL